MSDLFSGNISDGDDLVELMAELFGTGWHQIGLDNLAGTVSSSGSASMVIAILGAFSIVAMNAGAIVLGYVTFQASIGTAHEGQFMGKKFHDYWMPLRAGLAITFLAPVVKGGLCVIQIIGLIMIGYSIQFGNYIQKIGLNWMLEQNGRTTLSAIPLDMRQNVETLAGQLLKTAVIQHYYTDVKGKSIPKFCDPEKENDHYIIRFPGPRKYLGGQQTIGYVKIRREETSDIGDIRKEAVKNMYTTLAPLAQSIVHKAANKDNVNADHTPYEKSINDYITTISPHIQKIRSSENPDYQKELQEFIKKATDDGVVWLGSYYHTISRYSRKVHNITADFPTFHTLHIHKIEEDMTIQLETALKSTTIVEKNLEEKMSMVRKSSDSSKWKQVLNDVTYTVCGGLTEGFINSITKGDPLANLADYGHDLILAGEAIISSYLGLYFTANFAKGVKASVAGKALGIFTGGIDNGAVTALSAVIAKLWSVILFLVIPLISLGVVLAIYLPTVPYIIWTAALIGCVIQWIEFLVIMPLWAVTFTTGEGEGLAGQRSQQGLLLIMNALLRLPLMVIGFMIAIVLMPIVSKIIGATFSVFIADMSAEHVYGLFSLLGCIFIYSGFIILQSHAIFGLTTHLTDNCMKFFGGAISSMGEAQAEGRTRALVMTSLSKGEGAGNMLLGKEAPGGDNLAGQVGNNNQLANETNSIGNKKDYDPGERI